MNRSAAIAYAPLVNRARTGGRPISVADGQIAAIAAVHGITVATRDTAPFIAAGVRPSPILGKRDSASACPKGSHSPSAGTKKKAPPHECVAPKEPVAIGREDDRSSCSLSAHDRAFASPCAPDRLVCAAPALVTSSSHCRCSFRRRCPWPDRHSYALTFLLCADALVDAGHQYLKAQLTAMPTSGDGGASAAQVSLPSDDRPRSHSGAWF
jgi:hypothetical protein